MLTFHLQQPHEGANQVKESEVASVELVIAGGDAAELFDSVEEAFDKVTVLIQMPVIVACLRAIVTRRDHRLSPGFFDALDELVRIKGLVCDHGLSQGLSCQALHQRLCLGDIVALPRGEPPAHRIAQGLYHRLVLSAKSASGTPQGLGAGFFWAPAACW